MRIEVFKINGLKIAELISDNIEIRDTQDALDLMADCNVKDATRIIVNEKNLNPEFFDLKSGLAGEVLQKFSTYRNQLAIVGDFSNYSGKSMQDFIYESNKIGRINFVDSVEEAKKRLSRY